MICSNSSIDNNHFRTKASNAIVVAADTASSQHAGNKGCLWVQLFE
jgi:hypothetical protein